jgi:hypothetical protein
VENEGLTLCRYPLEARVRKETFRLPLSGKCVAGRGDKLSAVAIISPVFDGKVCFGIGKKMPQMIADPSYLWQISPENDRQVFLHKSVQVTEFWILFMVCSSAACCYSPCSIDEISM